MGNTMQERKPSIEIINPIKKPCCDWPLISDEKILREMLTKLNGWVLLEDEKDKNGNIILKISKKVKAKNFVSALDFFNKVGAIAEERNHHPDLHLTGFKFVQIVIFTFSLKGLTENDFNLAKAIDEVELK